MKNHARAFNPRDDLTKEGIVYLTTKINGLIARYQRLPLYDEKIFMALPKANDRFVVVTGRSRIGGDITAHFKRSVARETADVNSALINVSVIPVQYGYTINRAIADRKQISALNPTLLYSKEAVREHLARDAEHINMAGLLTEAVSTLGPDFLSIVVTMQEKKDSTTLTELQYYININDVLQLLQYAAVRPHTESFWVPFNSAREDYIRNVKEQQHIDFLKLFEVDCEEPDNTQRSVSDMNLAQDLKIANHSVRNII